MIRIIVDDREKNSKVPDELEELGVRVEYKHLEVGDYIPLPEVVVERKSMRDLVKSIYDNRLFIQCSN
ncbi:MAG: heavy metal resistance protein CzcA, partial [Candidatus Nitrosothermus koennekii]